MHLWQRRTLRNGSHASSTGEITESEIPAGQEGSMTKERHRPET